MAARSAVEPSDVSWKLADVRVRGTNVSILRSGLDGQLLPFADDSFDDASTGCRNGSAHTVVEYCRRVLPAIPAGSSSTCSGAAFAGHWQ